MSVLVYNGCFLELKKLNSCFLILLISWYRIIPIFFRIYGQYLLFFLPFFLSTKKQMWCLIVRIATP